MSKPILEKAIVHLLNGDQDKAEALFHKFMVEKARAIHESLRQDEEIDLGEGWDKEIAEEEYFGDHDLASAEDDGDEVGDSMDDLEGMNTVGDDGTGEDNVDGMGDADADLGDVEGDIDADADMEMGGEEDVGDKIDNLESKIDELTAEFDRLMSELEDHGGDDDGFGDDDGDEFGDKGDDDFSDEDVEDVEGEEPHMDADDSSDLVDRMDDDMADDDGTQPEDETMEGYDPEGDEIDEELADITESVLSELEKVAMPGNTSKEIGSGGRSVSGNDRTPFEPHSVNDRISQAKPWTPAEHMETNDSFERQPSPAVKPVANLVKGAKNSRTKWDQGMEKKSKEGDSSAALNSNFAGNEKGGQSPVDGNARMRPKTR